MAQDGSLWLLTPRFIRSGFSNPREPIAFQDDRTATVLLLDNQPKAKTFPVRFQRDGRPSDPFDRKGGGFPLTPQQLPFWLATPAGFVVASPDLAGHWLIPVSQLLSTLHSPATAQSAQANPGPISSSPPANEKHP